MDERVMQSQPVCSKKCYQVPSLRVYGDLQSLTQASGVMSMNADNGMGVNNKT